MRVNEGSWDRGLRLVTAVLFGSSALLGLGGGVGTAVATTACVVLIATAAVGVCPLYAAVGFSTCRLER